MNPKEHSEAMHEFYMLDEVRELSKQLHDGLLHPIEYSSQIILLAAKHGLWGN